MDAMEYRSTISYYDIVLRYFLCGWHGDERLVGGRLSKTSPAGLLGAHSMLREVIYENRSDDSLSVPTGGDDHNGNRYPERQEEFVRP